MPHTAPTIPEDARVALWLNTEKRVLDLSDDKSRRVLERYPSLLHQYRKHHGMTRTRGRLIVTDQELVSEIQPVKHPLQRGIKAQRGIEF